MKQIVFTPVIEGGKQAFRKPKEGEIRERRKEMNTKKLDWTGHTEKEIQELIRLCIEKGVNKK